MERKIFMMLALVAILFSSCDREDIDNTNFNNLSEKIAGKWMMMQFDGRTLPTNEKVVYTFESATKGYLTTSRVDFTDYQKKWNNYLPCNVTINGDKITMSGDINAFTSLEAELTMKAIIEDEMLTESKYRVYSNGELVSGDNAGTILWTRVLSEYRDIILGTWEGINDDLYGDGQLHRWQYNYDGTYNYYRQNANGEWVADINTMGEYFVDGMLLCTRWINNDGIEKREWWEIASIKNDIMTWYALRERKDGSTYYTILRMMRVQ